MKQDCPADIDSLPASTAAIALSQCTIAMPIEKSGVGLHSGEITQVRICPAPPDSGRVFVRTDLPGHPEIPAQVSTVRQTLLSTELATSEASVRTVEHLLAALSGCGVDNARMEVTGAELPLLDGSALGWAEAIVQAGLVAQSASRSVLVVTEPVWVRDQDAFVVALPSLHQQFSYGIEFDFAAIGTQWHSWIPHQESFLSAIAPARTFGLEPQIDALRAQGLIRGGSLENALVCGPSGWLNPPLRFPNEPVRHKLLDLVGDLSLLGHVPQAHILAYKASHRLHTQLTQQLLRQGVGC